MPIQLDKRVSLSSQGVRNPKLALSASVAVPTPVLRSLSHLPANTLKSASSVSKNAAGLVDITFRSGTDLVLVVFLNGIFCVIWHKTCKCFLHLQALYQ